MVADEGVGEGLTGEMYEMYNIYQCEVRREKLLYVNPKIDDVDSKWRSILVQHLRVWEIFEISKEV